MTYTILSGGRTKLDLYKLFVVDVALKVSPLLINIKADIHAFIHADIQTNI